MWTLPGLAVYRRVGYEIETHITQTSHICISTCVCKNCGQDQTHHPGERFAILNAKNCQRYEKNWIPHLRTIVALPIVLALWPLVAGTWGVIALKKHYGMEVGGFWTPAPEIESRDERRKRIAEQRAQEILELRRRNAELEAELGLGRSRPALDTDLSL
jgi:hypothetical protein